ncbi:ROK family transcriptional regulator [Streptomyces sp. ICBB 8177]|uniref:ROK family transcriptional regulator n=1 Tax=Streptomyces sp. ICBB 8177 TaxID=563922 RepID=UPI000D67F965|nr:ROK family transcriptional regulator [Streptomyces sp. ICBB 8177]PWI44416.1 ROK family protein [Streptomyces sp. ICBB 8177]
MRRQNLALVMGEVAAAGPVSRARVAEATGLTRAAVSSLVEELRAAGLVAERGPAPSGRVGRPGSDLVVDAEGPAGLGLEVGVGHLGACLADLGGRIRASLRVPADNRRRAPEAVLAQLADVAAEVTQEAVPRPAGAVVAVPGLVGTAEGQVAHAPNLGWRHVPAADLLRRRLPDTLAALPLEVDNEANLGALADLWCGAGAADAVHISAEAGIGAALLVGGAIFRGASGFAGELGHVPVRPDGPPCACGARGCLEQYAGEAAVLRAAGLDAATGDPVAELARRAERSDAAVLDALDHAGAALGIALAGAVNLIDPAAVVLGGAYAELGAWLLPGMRRELAARVAVRPWRPQTLALSGLGRGGPVLGAAMVTVRRIVTDPGGYAAGRTERSA